MAVEESVSERGAAARALSTLAAGVVIGGVEVVLCVSFAALIFGGVLVGHLADGIGLYLLAGAITLGLFAWLAGSRGVVASIQDAAPAVLAGVATSVVATAYGSPDRAFFTVIAGTMIVTVVCGLAFLLLGHFRLGNVVRFVPYPVVGGFLAGAGWILLKGGLGVAASAPLTGRPVTPGSMEQWVPALAPVIRALTPGFTVERWVPALIFGAVLLICVRVIKRPLVIPTVIALGLIGFALWMVVTGLSIDEARTARWLLGDFPNAALWQPWTLRAFTEHLTLVPQAPPVVGALVNVPTTPTMGTAVDWAKLLEQAPAIATAIFVAALSMLFNVSGTEVLLRRDLDTNRELRQAGVVNVLLGVLGGIPGYHALSLTSLADRMKVRARATGFIAALVPLAAVAFGAVLVGMIPRIVVGGVLVFIGLAFIVEWVVDARRVLPRSEYVVVLLILATIIGRGLLPGVVVGLVSAIVLFVVNYGRTELLREVEFGETYRSNVDRAPDERAALVSMRDRVQILRLDGFVFFGSASGLLERIRKRVEAGLIRFLVIDVRRVTGMDASAVESFRKIVQLAEAGGIELILAGASETVSRQLERGGVVAIEGVVRFEPDLDRALERSEDGLLEEAAAGAPAAVVGGDGSSEVLVGLPPGLRTYLQRESLPEGTVLIRQDEPPEDLFVLESGRLRVEMVTPEGTRLRLRTVLPGVVVGEVAMYTGVPRTADVVAATPCVVLRLSAASIERMEAAEPELAAALHRWLAKTLAERLGDTLRAVDALLD